MPSYRRSRILSYRLPLHSVRIQEEETGFLASVAAAVWVDRRIHVRYLSWEGESDRTLDPLGLVLKSGLWYLAARSPRKVRIYRVSRILSLEMTDQTFTRDPSFDLAIWWTEASADFEKTLYQAEAVLLVSPQGMHQLELRLNGPAPRVLPPAASSALRGWKRVRIPIVSFEDARYELLQLGADAFSSLISCLVAAFTPEGQLQRFSDGLDASAAVGILG